MKLILRYKVHILLVVSAMLPVDVIYRMLVLASMWCIYSTYIVWLSYRNERAIKYALRDAKCRKRMLNANKKISREL